MVMRNRSRVPAYWDDGVGVLLDSWIADRRLGACTARYLALLAKQTPIESAFIKALPDHLNAEVASGTVTTVEEVRGSSIM